MADKIDAELRAAIATSFRASANLKIDEQAIDKLIANNPSVTEVFRAFRDAHGHYPRYEDFHPDSLRELRRKLVKERLG